MRTFRFLSGFLALTLALVAGQAAYADNVASPATVRANGSNGVDMVEKGPMTYGVGDVTSQFMFPGFSHEPCAALVCAPASSMLPEASAPFSAFSTDVANTQLPEPASLLLFGSGLSVVGAVIRRRLSKSKAS